MKAELLEQVSQHRVAALRHKAAALIWFGEPVADAAITVRPVDGMAADAPGEHFAVPDAGVGPLVGLHLRDGARDEVAYILDGFGLVDPRQPFAKAPPIAVGDRIYGFGVAESERPHLD